MKSDKECRFWIHILIRSISCTWHRHTVTTLVSTAIKHLIWQIHLNLTLICYSMEWHYLLQNCFLYPSAQWRFHLPICVVRCLQLWRAGPGGVWDCYIGSCNAQTTHASLVRIFPPSPYRQLPNGHTSHPGEQKLLLECTLNISSHFSSEFLQYISVKSNPSSTLVAIVL